MLVTARTCSTRWDESSRMSHLRFSDTLRRDWTYLDLLNITWNSSVLQCARERKIALSSSEESAKKNFSTDLATRIPARLSFLFEIPSKIESFSDFLKIFVKLILANYFDLKHFPQDLSADKYF